MMLRVSVALCVLTEILCLAAARGETLSHSNGGSRLLGPPDLSQPSDLPFPTATVAGAITVSAHRSRLCASSDDDLEPLFRSTTFYQDLDAHRARNLTLADIELTVYRNAYNDSLHCDGGPNYMRASRIVMIRNNTIFSPWLVSAKEPLEGRLLWTLEFLSDAIERFGVIFPDVVFTLEVGDSCFHCNEYYNVIPTLTWRGFRHRAFDPEEHPLWDPGIIAHNHLFLLVPSTDDVDHTLYRYPWEKKKPVLFLRAGPLTGLGHPPEQVDLSPFGLNPDYSHARGFFFNSSNFPQYAHLIDAVPMEGAKDKHAVRKGWDAHLETLRPGFVSIRDHARFRYLLALDGLTVSQRLAKLMHTDSVVLKEDSGWEEYYYAALEPWTHYVPILHNGPLDAFEIIEAYRRNGSEHELRRIAGNSQRFAERFLCFRARALYWRRLLVEYKRLFRGGQDMDAFVRSVELKAGSAAALQPFNVSEWLPGAWKDPRSPAVRRNRRKWFDDCHRHDESIAPVR